MNKHAVILVCMLLAGCHFICRKTPSAAPIPNKQETISTTLSEQPQQTADPLSQTAADIYTQSKPLTAASVSPAGQAKQSKQTVTPSQETATETEIIPETPQFTPFSFTPTFKGEDVINTDGRMLNPYAELVPNPSEKQTAPWAYEQLKYGLYYSFIKAGTAYIHNLGLVNIDGRPAYVFQTTAFSAPVIDAVFKVRDINQSWLDASEFYSYGYDQSVREGNYVRDEWLKFNYPAKKYQGLIRKKEEPREISGPLDIKVVDMLSSLYYVRAHDLKVGQNVTFDIVNREKQYPLIVKVLKKEKVKVAAGKFDCIVVEPQFRGEGIFISKGKSLKVWLTDDQYRMPVKMKVEVFIGSVSAELLEYQRQAPANIL